MKKLASFIMATCIGLAVVAPGSSAEEKALSDEGELSYVQTDGNTKVTTLAVKNLAKYKFSETLTGSWKIGAMSAETDNVKTAENYFTDIKLDYQNTLRLYSFINAGWLQNKFTGIDRRLYGGVGAGYKFLDGPNNFLIGELGVTYVSDKYTDDTGKDYPGGRAFAKYTHAFTEKSRFSQSLEYLTDLKDSKRYNVNSETAVISALSGILSLKTAYLVNYTNAPVPATLKRKDSTLTVAMVVNY